MFIHKLASVFVAVAMTISSIGMANASFRANPVNSTLAAGQQSQLGVVEIRHKRRHFRHYRGHHRGYHRGYGRYYRPHVSIYIAPRYHRKYRKTHCHYNSRGVRYCHRRHR